MEPEESNLHSRESCRELSDETAEAVRDYWDAYATGLKVPGTAWGSREFFAKIKAAHDESYAPANQALNLARIKGKSLLELGCGIGLDTVEFARYGAQVTAIDLSPDCIKLAQRLLLHHGLEATFKVGDAENLLFPAASFDIVVARGLLMYTPNDAKVMSEIVRVLKPGGEANILLHNRISWYVFLARISGTTLFGEANDPPVNRLYSIREARKMLEQFSSYRVRFDRFPCLTSKRTGTVAHLYNKGFVPLTHLLPSAVLRPVGFYIIVQATK